MSSDPLASVGSSFAVTVDMIAAALSRVMQGQLAAVVALATATTTSIAVSSSASRPLAECVAGKRASHQASATATGLTWLTTAGHRRATHQQSFKQHYRHRCREFGALAKHPGERKLRSAPAAVATAALP
jgi:hypothetical protein